MKSLVCIGDSLTEGYPYGTASGFPAVLKKELGIPVYNRGISGETSFQIMRRFERDAVYCDADTVLILAGANDAIFRIYEPDESFRHMKQMIRMTLEAGKTPVVCTCLLLDEQAASIYWNSDSEGVNEQLQEYNSILRTYCAQNGIAVIDLEEKWTYFDLYGDGVHPTQRGYQILAGLILKGLKELYNE